MPKFIPPKSGVTPLQCDPKQKFSTKGIIKAPLNKVTRSSSVLSKLFDHNNKKKNRSTCAKAKITDIQILTRDIKLVTLKVLSKEAVKFQPGQFMGVYDGRKKDDKFVDTNNSIFPGTFSIASPPFLLPYIRFAIGKDENPRNMRHFLYFQAKIGDPLLLDKNGSGTVAITPRMVMTPVGGPGGLMLIGGGSAVMGLVSIVEELLQDKEGKKIPSLSLFHSNRSNDNIPFYERMQELEQNNDNFHYKPHITGSVEEGEELKGTHGRINIQVLAKCISGVRLFCICGSGIFCEAMVNSLLELGVWPGAIRTDYTTRVDPVRKLDEIEQVNNDDDILIKNATENVMREIETTISSSSSSSSDMVVGTRNTHRFESCTDATQSKGSMASSGDEYLRTYGLDVLLDKIKIKLTDEKPEFPLQFLSKEIQKAQEKLPEISNKNAGDPNFWINYWETDNVTWQAPVTSPWLEKYMEEFVGTSEQKTVFVPLCGKTLDLKLLLDAGHCVVGADCSGIACVDFFTENNIPDYVQETVDHPNGKRIICHRSTSCTIEIYEGDIFDLTPEIVGHIDAVLDRAALVALPPSIIEDQYLPLITSLLCRGGKMLFASVSELPFPKAPPHAYETQMIERILSLYFKKIELKEVYRYRVNAGHVTEPIYMLEAK